MRRIVVLSLSCMGLALLLASCAEPPPEKTEPDEGGMDNLAWSLPPAPPKSAYNGPVFELSHNYPISKPSPPEPAPWQQAIGNGLIDTGNAEVYVNELKAHVADDMRVLIFDYANWDAAARGWYNLPWLTSLEKLGQPIPGSLREAIHGTYVGSSFPPAMFPISNLQASMTTHVLVYYDEVAAWTARQIWGDDADNPIPGLEAGGTQFPEGSIVVKVAATSADASTWAPMVGAQQWPIYAPPGDGTSGDPVLQNTSVFQFDLIVKDSQSAPKTGWVFATLVYDQSAPGDGWDKLVPLGAMWGNDPDVISPQGCDYLTAGGCPALSETWINQQTPVYARETLGWGGRLSGPNDGSVDISAVVQTDSGLELYEGRYAMSSCMGCHSTAQYLFDSFLLPVPSKCADDSCTPTFAKCTNGTCTEAPPGPGVDLVYYQTGSDEFMRWFQDRPGDAPMDPGQIATDYGMNYAFKALPQWFKATGQAGKINHVEDFNNYRGLRYDDE